MRPAQVVPLRWDPVARVGESLLTRCSQHCLVKIYVPPSLPSQRAFALYDVSESSGHLVSIGVACEHGPNRSPK